MRCVRDAYVHTQHVLIFLLLWFWKKTIGLEELWIKYACAFMLVSSIALLSDQEHSTRLFSASVSLLLKWRKLNPS